MVSKTQRILNRYGEERRNQESGEEIVCPYCQTEQESETKHGCVSYWGDDSTKNISCEHCNKEFQVEEHVERTFTTTTLEWIKKEDRRIKRLFKKSQEKNE